MKLIMIKGVRVLLVVSLLLQAVFGFGMFQIGEIKAADSSEIWNAIDTEPLVAPGSAMDLSYMNHKPAGKYGFVKIDDNGNYYFENAPDKKVRFYGPNLVDKLLYPTKDQAEALADRLAAMGYNVVRFHYQDYMQTWSQGIFKQPTTTLNPENGEFTVELDARSLDKLDYLIYALKERGIYVSVTIMCGFDMTKIPELSQYAASFESFKQLYLYLPEAMTVWKAAAKAWLTHVNPYTGLALKDDPVLVGVEPSNETHSVYNQPTSSTLTNAFRERVLEEINGFMTQKGKPKLPTLINYNSASNEVKALLLEYYTGKMLDVYTQSRDYLKNDLGVKAPVGGIGNYNGAVYDLWRTPLDTHETHLYSALVNSVFTESSADGTRSGTQYNPSAFEPLTKAFSTTKLPNDFYWNYYPSLSLDQTYGKPFVLSEYNHGFPAAGRDQMGIMLGGVSAHQGWDMMNEYRFAGINISEGLENQINGAGRGLTLVGDPPAIISSYQQALLYRTGYVKESKPSFVIVRDRNWSSTHVEASYVANGIENFLYVSHLFNTQTVFADKPGEPVAVYKITPDVSSADILSGNLPAANKLSFTSGMTKGQIAEMLINTLEDSSIKTEMSHALQKNQLMSDTGDLIFDLNLHTYMVNTPGMAAIAGALGNNKFELGKVTLSADSESGTISASSLDNKEMSESARILLLYTTDTKGTGEEVVPQSNGTVKYYLGNLPTLAKQGKAQFTMTTSLNPKGYRAYKLAMNGTRLEEIPVTADGSAISVDMVTDKGFAFELVYAPNTVKDTIAPTAPKKLKATVAPMTSKVYLTWEKSSDNESVAVYKIYDSTGRELGTVNGSLHDYNITGAPYSFTYHDMSDFSVTDLIPGETYKFCVKAVDPSGNPSRRSDWVTVQIPKVLFQDNFSDGVADGWRNEANKPGGTWGKYGVVEDKDSNVYIAYNESACGASPMIDSVSTAGDGSWTDYTVASKVKVDQWTGKVGLAARYVANTYYYFMAYDSTNQQVTITSRLNGKDTVLATEKIAPLEEGRYYEFRFQVEGSNLRAYIKDQLVASATDSNIGKGYFGIYTSAQVGYFDKVEVTN